MSKVSTTPISNLSFVPGVNLNDSPFPEVDLANAEELLAQCLSDRSGRLDLLADGTLYEFFVRAGVIPYMVNRRMLETFRQTMSLKGVEDNPTVADADVVAALMSNYMISQNVGALAVGTVTVQVSESRTYRIPAGAVFTTSDGLEFLMQGAVTASPTPVGDEVPLYSQGDGLFFFLVPVVAAQVGTQYNVALGTEMSLSISLRDLVLCSARTNFQKGSDGEGFVDIRQRILAALAARNMVSHDSIFSVIKASFPDLVASKCVGIGDALMLRSRQTLIGAPVGGIVDVYVRTSETPVSVSVAKTALPVAGKTETYSCTINRDEAPGHYFVRSIRPASGSFTGTYPVLSTERSINNVVAAPDGTERVPNRISSVMHGVYSRWQETTIEFSAPSSDVLQPSGNGLAVVVDLFCLPYVKEIQALFSDPGTRVGGTDFLVKAFVPCMVTLSDIRVRTSSGDVTETLVRSVIMSYVNRLPAGSGIRVDGIVAAITSIPFVDSVDLPITVTGEVYCPDAGMSVGRFSSASILEIPVDDNLGIGPDNTAFFLEADQIPVFISHE